MVLPKNYPEAPVMIAGRHSLFFFFLLYLLLCQTIVSKPHPWPQPPLCLLAGLRTVVVMAMLLQTVHVLSLQFCCEGGDKDTLLLAVYMASYRNITGCTAGYSIPYTVYGTQYT